MELIGEGFPERFRKRLVPGPNGCWNWSGYLNRGGYGQYTIANKTRTGSHRFAWAFVNGDIPEGFQIDHLCRNRACANPAHLEAVTASENVMRGTAPLRAAERMLCKTECPKGHPYDDANTRHYGGKRYCKACIAADARRRYLARKNRENLEAQQRA